MLNKIEKILNRDVRPFLCTHGGDVRVCGFDRGTVRIKMLGSCAGCLEAAETKDHLISEALKKNLPEVRDVVLVNDVDPELLDLAKRILNHESVPELS